MINFAQGEIATFAAFICWALVDAAQLPLAVAVAVSVLAAALGAFCIERVIVRPFEHGPRLTIVIVTLALFEITNSVAGLFWATRHAPSHRVPGETRGDRGCPGFDARAVRQNEAWPGMRAAALYPEMAALLGARTALMLGGGAGWQPLSARCPACLLRRASCSSRT